jgi:hypothetical protein
MKREISLFIIRKIMRVKIGIALPWYANTIKWIFFPIDSLSYRSRIYDWQTDTYKLEGIFYSAELFRAWAKDGLPIGTVFQIKRREENGVVTLRIFNSGEIVR